MTIPLQSGIVYGPVNSRRLGRSLGINLLPIRLKICSFNCVYCQYGWTRVHAQVLEDESEWPALNEVVRQVTTALESMSLPPAYITFSGNGEPTLHPRFAEIAERIIMLRDQFAPAAKTALLSNSSTLRYPGVREAISRLDERIMKLDCGEDACFRRYNRPCPGVLLGDIVAGLSAIPDVTIQTLFCDGPDGNFNEPNLTAWIDKLQIISPKMVQLYTLDRGYPSDKILPVPKDSLLAIKSRLDLREIPAEVFSREH